VRIKRWLGILWISCSCALSASACGESEETPQQTDPAEPAGDAPQEIGGFSISLFPFKTTVEDDGADVGGGYQEASTTLTFADGRQEPTARWSCSYLIGMPLRTLKFGKMDPVHAALITAQVATNASRTVMHSRSAWLPSAF